MNSLLKATSIIAVASFAFLGAAHTSSLVTPALADTSSEASSGDATRGYSILKCYHPSADFVHASFSTMYSDANGRATIDGQIEFRGGWTGNHYAMTFVTHYMIENKDTLARTTVLTDDAPFVPNPQCRLTQWRRID